ncbi:MAG TPA: Fic family protein [Polyangiaceae bacterium]|nr:Fic family protein [Polyangiaceae bacterium]
MRPYRPPFQVTPDALAASLEITRLIGRYEGLFSPPPQPKLRRQNAIRTVVATVAIEGNTLTADQVTAILEKKRVVGPKHEILEVQNAIETYALAASFDPTKESDLLRAHRHMMNGLTADAGRYRTKGVGVVEGSRILHVAPPAKRVRAWIGELLGFLKKDRDTPALVKAAVVHYELEFIHPFSDGNGRIGRLWQHAILLRYHPLFGVVPVESIIHQHQERYYRTLAECDRTGDASSFVEFSLRVIEEALREFLNELKPKPMTSGSRLEAARTHFAKNEFSRKDYLAEFKMLSTATASRDLKEGVDAKLLVKIGDKARSRYRFR